MRLSRLAAAPYAGTKHISSFLLFAPLVPVAAWAGLLPYELRWAVGLAMVEILRKVFKLNVEALVLVVREIGFLLPFTTNALGAFFGSASFDHEPGAAFTFFVYASLYTVTLMGKSWPRSTHRSSALSLELNPPSLGPSQRTPTWSRARSRADDSERSSTSCSSYAASCSSYRLLSASSDITR